jgi:two-component system nitrate/nitrite sensor histidine kinase NarX
VNFLFASHRDRHTLYTALVILLAGCSLAALLSFLGSIEMRRQSHEVLAAAIGDCGKFFAASDETLCSTLAQSDALLVERGRLMLVLQGLCLVLIVIGLGAIARRARAVLGQLPQAAAAALARVFDPIAAKRNPEQIQDLALREGEALQLLRQAGRELCDGPASEVLVLKTLERLQAAMGASTVALRLTEEAREALAAPTLLSTGGVPALATQRLSEPDATDAMLRVITPTDQLLGSSLLVPLRNDGEPLAMLMVVFDPSQTIDIGQISLAESFSFVLALAISSLCRSKEDRRMALLEERSAIAGELHDSLAQSLAFMKMQAAQLQRVLDHEHAPDEARKAVQDLRGVLSGTYRDVRELIAAFRVHTGSGGLAASVQDTIDELVQRSGMDIHFEHELDECPLEVNEEFHIMQVVREALSNIVRHAAATQAWVCARYGPEHLFTMTIADNGRGLAQASSNGNHHGMSIMRERARSLGGDVVIKPRPDGGTQVCLSFCPQRVRLTPSRHESAR